MTTLIILDVDGTLTPFRQGSTGRFERRLLPGVEERLRTLVGQDVIIVLASNQGGVRKGLPVGAVHQHMRWLVKLLKDWGLQVAGYKFAVQPGPRKKPGPRMLVEWMTELGIPPSSTLFVGDAESDAQAARAAGCRFAWAKDFFKEDEDV